jgi:hypothetical protein
VGAVIVLCKCSCSAVRAPFYINFYDANFISVEKCMTAVLIVF